MPKSRCKPTFSGKIRILIVFGAAAGILAAASIFRDRSRHQPGVESADLRPDSRPSGSAAVESAPRPPVSVPGAPPAVSTPRAPEVREKIKILHEILESRNDNDPRIDRELKGLSKEAKSALKEEYTALRKEDRNGRGTIAFLIGREIDGEADLEFLRQILAEAPCLSLADCGRDMTAARGADAHQDAGIETTLAYPQIVVLHSLNRFLELGGRELTPALRDAAWKIIEEARHSPVPLLARKAAELARKLEAGN